MASPRTYRPAARDALVTALAVERLPDVIEQASNDGRPGLVGDVEERPRGNPAVARTEVMHRRGQHVPTERLVRADDGQLVVPVSDDASGQIAGALQDGSGGASVSK